MFSQKSKSALISFAAVMTLGLLAPLNASAAPVVPVPADVDLVTLALPRPVADIVGRVHDTLSNGVEWSVVIDPGPASFSRSTTDYYEWRAGDGKEIWTFSVPVNLEFTITNLNGGPNTNQTEGVILPPGTKCDVTNFDPAWDLKFDVPTATLWHAGPTDHGGPVQYVEIPCTLKNVTTLTLDGTGFDQTLLRGLGKLTVTPVVLTGSTAVPTLNEWTLVLMALALAGMAGLGFKRRA